MVAMSGLPVLQIQGLGGAKKKQDVAEVVHKDVV